MASLSHLSLALFLASTAMRITADKPIAPFPAEPLASWTSQGINYVWDDNNTRADYLASGAYQPNFNNMAGIKIKPGSTPEATVVYISVPRWFPGVPSTLNQITLNLTDPTVPVNVPLEPFPSWQANAIGGDCSGMQYVQSMEIDNQGLMWIIDTGRINIFHSSVDNSCPPKLMIIDTATGAMVDEPYIFPDDIASHNSTHLNDLVIDNVNQIAYITDSSDAGLIVYDRNTRQSRRYVSDTMFPDGMGGAPDLDVNWTINGDDLGSSWPGASVPMDGIALTPDNKRIYYTTLGGLDLYSLDAAAAHDFTVDDATYASNLDASLVKHGDKVDATDGMAFTCNGELIYGALTQASVYSWTATADTSSDPTLDSILQVVDDVNMHWVDTFGFDDTDGSLWFTVNFLHELFTTGVAGPAHLFKIPTAGSYQKGPCNVLPTEARTAAPTVTSTNGASEALTEPPTKAPTEAAIDAPSAAFHMHIGSISLITVPLLGLFTL